MSDITEVTLDCDGWCDRTGEVAMIDNKGYIYCTPCGLHRRGGGVPCRQLRPHEMAKLKRGEQIARY